MMMQEPVFENEGYDISHPGYRLVRGKGTMTRIQQDMHLEFCDVEMG